MSTTFNHIVKTAVEMFFESDTSNMAPHEVEHDLLEDINTRIDFHNSENFLKGSEAISKLKSLPPIVVAHCLLNRHHVVRIALSGKTTDSQYDIIAIYQESGPDEGIYITNEAELRTVARQYSFTLSERDFREVMVALGDSAPRVMVNQDRDLVAVANGILDYSTKTLLPFDPATVFTSKAAVPWDPTITNPILTNPDDGTQWDIESWMNELSDDPEIVALLWEILSAIIRPNVSWDKTAWFLSEVGNNGKGTLLTLMRNLCGERAWTSIPVADFSKDFFLEPLVGASAILVDENDVGEYVDKAANFKAVVTNDVILINRKNKTPIAYQFRGFMVQCVNDTPRFRDKSGSLYRRQLIVPFSKSFTGIERRYIKHEYMSHPDVLKYVLHKVLSSNFYELSEPAAVVEALNKYKIDNDPIRGFLEDILPHAHWDLLPWKLLYALYKSWVSRYQPSSSILGYNKFQNQIKLVLDESLHLGWKATATAVRTEKYTTRCGAEPLAAEYGIAGWSSTALVNGAPMLVGTPTIDVPVSTRGIIRSNIDTSDAIIIDGSIA